MTTNDLNMPGANPNPPAADAPKTLAELLAIVVGSLANFEAAFNETTFEPSDEDLDTDATIDLLEDAMSSAGANLTEVKEYLDQLQG